jgi:hypothetical protein
LKDFSNARSFGENHNRDKRQLLKLAGAVRLFSDYGRAGIGESRSGFLKPD